MNVKQQRQLKADYTHHIRSNMEGSKDSPVVRGRSSTTACGRPRCQRAVVDSASTSVRPRSARVRRHQPWSRRRRGTALEATNDCDAGAEHG